MEKESCMHQLGGFETYDGEWKNDKYNGKGTPL